MDYYAYTNGLDPKYIIIVLSPKIVLDKLPSIFVHELGEADYITRRLPYVKDNLERDKFFSRLNELFSHSHIHNLVVRKGLDRIEASGRIKQLEETKNKNFANEYPINWQCVLMISWTLVAFPELKSERFLLNGYEENFYRIEHIIKTISSIDTLKDNPDIVSLALKEVINCLGLNNEFTIYNY